MSTELITTPLPPPRIAWNKGRIVGQKRPLQPKHVWSIRIRLEMPGDLRDLALFNMAIDSKLRGCDLVRLQVHDVFAAGQVRERASVFNRRPDALSGSRSPRPPAPASSSGSPVPR